MKLTRNARDDRYTVKNDYIIEFTDSVRGLTVGAPVEFRGMQIGTVVDFGLKADFDKLELYHSGARPN